MAFCTSPLRSLDLLTICFDGVAAIHPLDEELGSDFKCSPVRVNPGCATVVNAQSGTPYFVIATKDGVLSLFRLVYPQQDEGVHAQISIRPIRTLSTGLASLYQICVLKSGIIVGGLSRNAGLSFLYFDFAIEAE